MKILTSRSTLILSVLVIPFLLASCGKAKLEKQNTKLQSDIDSLSLVLDDHNKTLATLGEIGSLLDTIESQRNILRLEMVEGGVSYEDFVQRIEMLNKSYQEAENKVNELEKTRKAYAGIVKNMKNELAEKETMIASLEAIVEDLRSRNAEMTTIVELQEEEIADLEDEIEDAENELKFFEERIAEMVELEQMSEADAYYARATAYEEAARRTKFARKKKKETLQQALNLYQQSLDLGKEEAQAKVDELGEKLK